MTWACNGTDDTPYCAESSLCSVYAMTSGLPCLPAAETLPRRDETYSQKIRVQSVMYVTAGILRVRAS